MVKNKMLYGLLALFVGIAFSFNSATAQITEQDGDSLQSFTGQVVDASNGQPLSDVTVTVQGQDVEATTDQDGMFTLENLQLAAAAAGAEAEGMGAPSEGVTIEISHPGYQPFSRTLSADEISQGAAGAAAGEMGQPAEEPMKFELQPEEGQY